METMKGLVWRGNGEIQLTDLPRPRLREPEDAVVRVTLSTICTSDLHILRGAVPRAIPNTVLGHEFVGVVEEAGPLSGVRPGQRVAANCITFCGDCWFCRRGFVNNCEKGGWELGCRIDGGQAEYVRVPYAHTGLTSIPPQVTDEQALFLGDILSSGYFGAQLCEIHPGDTVAVIGAGPVGLCAMMCARLFGAAQVIALDINPKRLRMAWQQKLADATIHPSSSDPEQAVKALTNGRGADGVIEAAGGENTFQTAWKIARPNGVVALVAMYEENQTLPLPQMYGKNLIFKTGGVDAAYCQTLMDLMARGRLDPSFLITHKAPLNEILEGYRIFGEGLEDCVKWAVTPYERSR